MTARLGDFLQLPVTVEIVNVESEEQLLSCVQYLSEKKVVGIDAEWCPTTKELALLQIATDSRYSTNQPCRHSIHC